MRVGVRQQLVNVPYASHLSSVCHTSLDTTSSGRCTCYRLQVAWRNKSTADLKKVYALMTADISDYLTPESTMAERRVGSQRCLTGQPVDIPGGSVLRTVLGAAQLKDLVSGKQQLNAMLEDDRVLLAKLALIARQYNYLLSHSL